MSVEMVRRLLMAAAIIALAIWVRVASSAQNELERARTAEAAGRLEQAVLHYQYALRWYTPFAGAPRRAADALWRIGEQARRAGDEAGALRSLRALRGGILATRHLLSPLGERLPAVNRRIARLTAGQQARQPSARGRDQATLEKHHLRLLQLDPTPPVCWSLLVVLCFVGFVAGAFLALARGLDRQGRLVRTEALKWAALGAACFIGWMVGLIYG